MYRMKQGPLVMGYLVLDAAKDTSPNREGGNKEGSLHAADRDLPPAPEARKKAGPGVSPGMAGPNGRSPSGAAESFDGPYARPWVLSPRPGLVRDLSSNPQLTLWAII